MVSSENYHSAASHYYIGGAADDAVGLSSSATRCLNDVCNKISLTAQLWRTAQRGADRVYVRVLHDWKLLPEGTSKPQPEYIPAPIREDYFEACLIRDLSPKAAATLARRCLQGMIRDFCNIVKGRLIDEIKELRTQVDQGTAPKGVEPETVDAIDSIREIGNIGAHMEKDISLIVDVDPGEAQALIELIEMLFEEWYVARHSRQQKLDRIKAVAAEKKATLSAQKAEKALLMLEVPSEE